MYSSNRINKFLEANISIVEFESKKMVGVNFFRDVDLTAIEHLRLEEKEAKTPYTAFVVKAVARALSEHPHVNARIFENYFFSFYKTLVSFSEIDIAIAVERSGPELEAVAFCDIVRSADKQSLEDITSILRQLSKADTENNRQWRDFSNVIRRLPRWLCRFIFRLPFYLPHQWVKYRGGSVVVSSPSKYGVDSIAATWIWPIGVSFGLVQQKAVVKSGRVTTCPVFTLTLSFDRRMLAGAQAAKFLNRITYHLEHPNDAPPSP